LVGSEGCNVLGRVRAIVTGLVVSTNHGVNVEDYFNEVTSRVRALSQRKVEPSFFREVAELAVKEAAAVLELETAKKYLPPTMESDQVRAKDSDPVEKDSISFELL